MQAINVGAGCGDWVECQGSELISLNSADEAELARIRTVTDSDYEKLVAAAHGEWQHWRMHPAPLRGQVIRAIAEELRKYKRELSALITFEIGKTWAKSQGEVQDVIDIADFALGLSRQLYEPTMYSERRDIACMNNGIVAMSAFHDQTATGS